MDKNICLKVNGQDIMLNAFVKSMITNVVEGMVDSLDKIPEKRNKIELIIDEEENK